MTKIVPEKITTCKKIDVTLLQNIGKGNIIRIVYHTLVTDKNSE